MNPLLSVVVNHLLTIIEHELLAAAPSMVNITVKEIELLIAKLQAHITDKLLAANSAVMPSTAFTSRSNHG